MPRCQCNKKYITLIWALLECLFFSGIVFGWSWLTIALKKDRFFLDLCNTTLPDNAIMVQPLIVNPDPLSEAEVQISIRSGRKCRIRKKIESTTPDPELYLEHLYQYPFNETHYFCDEQEERMEILNAIIVIVRNVLVLPVGIFLDKYGTTRTRLIAVLSFILGTIIMTFANAGVPWLVAPAFSLISTAGLIILLTNLQVSNLFANRRNLVMCSLIGAFHSSSVVLLMMKETHSNKMETQTSFMFLTIGVVPILVSTIAFLPKSRVPWPLPAGYGNSDSAWKEAPEYRKRKSRNLRGGQVSPGSLANFRLVCGSSLCIWSCVWFGIQYLRAFTYDGNLRLMLFHYGANTETVFYYQELFSLMHVAALLAGPIFGIMLDWQRNSSYNPCIQQMRNILTVTVITFIIALGNNILTTIPSLGVQILGFILQTIERVGVYSCLCAFLMHVHFPTELFGKLIGTHFLAACIISLLRFPFQIFIITNLDGNPFYVNLFLLLLLLVSCGHPINIWYHCRLGFFKNSYDSVPEMNEIAEDEEIVIAAEGTP